MDVVKKRLEDIRKEKEEKLKESLEVKRLEREDFRKKVDKKVEKREKKCTRKLILRRKRMKRLKG